VERACFGSHHEVITENCDDDAALFILEDDSLFCAKSCCLIDKAVAGIAIAAAARAIQRPFMRRG